MVVKFLRGDRFELERRVVGLLVDVFDRVIKEKGRVVFAIPGGRSVTGIFELLKKEDMIDWSKVHVFLVDERLTDIYSEDSNFRQANELFLHDLIVIKRLPEENVHPFIHTPSHEDEGLGDYEVELREFGDFFDVVLLGVGEDGHVGALYPKSSVLDAGEFFIKMHDSPKPPKDRMSSGKHLLERSNTVFVFFFGEGKKQAYLDFLNPDLKDYDVPVKIVKKAKNTFVVTDIIL